jgi:energy-coupling factor transporter ATP-binding protein EcfA2
MALHKGMGPLGITPASRVSRLAMRYVEQLEVNPPDLDAPVGILSGGNQQKVLVGKALAAQPQVLIIDQPTAGVDVGTKAQLHRVLRDLADSGAPLLVVSDDLDELFTLSDRMCVMRRGPSPGKGQPPRWTARSYYRKSRSSAHRPAPLMASPPWRRCKNAEHWHDGRTGRTFMPGFITTSAATPGVRRLPAPVQGGRLLAHGTQWCPAVATYAAAERRELAWDVLRRRWR